MWPTDWCWVGGRGREPGDRRFYRQKYNAEQTIARFAAAARSGSDLDVLTTMLEEVVQVNLQPTQVNLLLKAPGEEG